MEIGNARAEQRRAVRDGLAAAAVACEPTSRLRPAMCMCSKVEIRDIV